MGFAATPRRDYAPLVTPTEVAALRLRAQGIAGTPPAEPREVVARLGAVQAQDYLGSLWAVGLRTKGATERRVEQALADRTLVRTWPLRGTLHLVAAEDVRWMLALVAPRVIASAAARFRQLELDAATFARSRKVLRRALEGGRALARPDVVRALEAARISTAGQRGISPSSSSPSPRSPRGDAAPSPPRRGATHGSWGCRSRRAELRRETVSDRVVGFGRYPFCDRMSCTYCARSNAAGSSTWRCESVPRTSSSVE